jgi:hypothetical protein
MEPQRGEVLIPTPEFFTCERIGGGFEAFIARMVVPKHTHAETVEFWLCHQGTASAHTTIKQTLEPCFVEVSVHDLSCDEPAAAVALMEALGLIGGDNGDSGALTWYFSNMAEATQWIDQAVQTAASAVISWGAP